MNRNIQINTNLTPGWNGKKCVPLTLCEGENKKLLGGLALSFFNKKCEQITYEKSYNLHNTPHSSWSNEDGIQEEEVKYFYEAFSRLESYAVITRHKEKNKSYKEWLFDNVSSSEEPLKVINGCVLSINTPQSWICTIVKIYLKECGFKFDSECRLYNRFNSLDVSLDDDNTTTKLDMLSDTMDGDDVNSLAVYKQIAEEYAERYEAELDKQMRIALVTDFLKLTRSNKELLKIVEFTSSSGFNYLFEKKIPALLKTIIMENIKLAGKKITEDNFSKPENKEELMYLVAFIAQALRIYALKRIIDESDSEKMYHDFLLYCKEKEFDLCKVLNAYSN